MDKTTQREPAFDDRDDSQHDRGQRIERKHDTLPSREGDKPKTGRFLIADVLRKNVTAVHSASELTLKERIAANVLLKNAMEAIGANDSPTDVVGLVSRDKAIPITHTIRMSDLTEQVYGVSNSTSLMKETLKGLASKPIEWNYIDEDNTPRWGITTWLSEAEQSLGVVFYSYSVKMASELLRPTRFARLNYSIQQNLVSKHTHALYENCARYRNIGQTPTWSLDTFKALMGLKGRYKQFKKFNAAVIKPAVAEVNAKTEIHVEAHFKRIGRTVAKISFTIRENETYSGPVMTDLQHGRTGEVDPAVIEGREDVFDRLLGFRIRSDKAAELLQRFEDDRIKRNTDHAISQLQNPSVSIGNPSGFVIRAIEKDYASAKFDTNDEPQQALFDTESEEVVERDQAKKELHTFLNSSLRQWRVNRWHQSQSEEDLEQHRLNFYESKVRGNTVMIRFWDKDPNSVPVMSVWREWVNSEVLDAPTEEEAQQAAAEVGVELDELRLKAGYKDDE